MSRPFDVCIRGAGIVGRTLALHLAAKQLRVALTQPDQDALATSDVRAYALNAASRSLLAAVRCWPPDATHATAVRSMEVHDHDSTVRFNASETGAEALNWIVDAAVLETLLGEAVRFQPLIEVIAAPCPASLTIVCEGRYSRSRDDWGVQWDVQPYQQSALATRVQCALGHGQVARQWFFQGEILAFLPLDGADGQQCAIVWSVSPDRAQVLHTEPPEQFCEALQTASHGALGALTLSGDRKVWPLQQALARRWCGISAQGAWVLAGDAAHNIHPLAGQGLNLGLADAAQLVHILTQRPYWRSVGDPKLLRQYERARKADFALLGQANDALQQLFTHAHPAVQALRHWGLHQFQHSKPLQPLKQWVAKRAMGTLPPPSSQGKNRP